MSLAYAFWCSKCKATHGGECPPPAVVPSIGVPLVSGSVWRKMIRVPGSAMDEWGEGVLWRVVEFDQHTWMVTVERAKWRSSADDQQVYPLAAWGIAGAPTLKNSRVMVKFVEIP